MPGAEAAVEQQDRDQQQQQRDSQQQREVASERGDKGRDRPDQPRTGESAGAERSWRADVSADNAARRESGEQRSDQGARDRNEQPGRRPGDLAQEKIGFGVNESAVDRVRFEAMYAALVRDAADKLQDPSYEIVIRAGASRSGEFMHNMELSLKRAEELRQCLVEKGVEAQIVIDPVGEQDAAEAGVEDGTENSDDRAAVLSLRKIDDPAGLTDAEKRALAPKLEQGFRDAADQVDTAVAELRERKSVWSPDDSVLVEVRIEASLLESSNLNRDVLILALEAALGDTDISLREIIHSLPRTDSTYFQSEEALRELIREALARGENKIHYETNGQGIRQLLDSLSNRRAFRARMLREAAQRLHDAPDYAGRAIADIYIGHVNGLTQLLNGLFDTSVAVPNALQRIRGAERIGSGEYIPQIGYLSSYGEKYGSTIEFGAILGLILVGGPAAMRGATRAFSSFEAGAMRALERFTVGGLNIGRWVGNGLSAGYRAGLVAESGFSGYDLGTNLLTIVSGNVYESGSERPATEQEMKDAWEYVAKAAAMTSAGFLSSRLHGRPLPESDAEHPNRNESDQAAQRETTEAQAAARLGAGMEVADYMGAIRLKEMPRNSAGLAWDHENHPTAPRHAWEPGMPIDMPGHDGLYPRYGSGTIRQRWWRNRAYFEIQARNRGAERLTDGGNPVAQLTDAELQILLRDGRSSILNPSGAYSSRWELEHWRSQQQVRTAIEELHPDGTVFKENNLAGRLIEEGHPDQLWECMRVEHGFWDRFANQGLDWRHTGQGDLRMFFPLQRMTDLNLLRLVETARLNRSNFDRTPRTRRLHRAIVHEVERRGLDVEPPEFSPD